MLARLCLVLWWAIAGAALSADDEAPQREEPNGALLVARPGLIDPNFRQTVVLVTQRPDGSTVGVILNRPTQLELAPLLPGLPAANYKDALYFGGPVMRRSVVAVFESATAPASSAFHVLRGIYLSMHDANIARLLESGAANYRIYIGFSGWGPGQLEGELLREGWYVLPADPKVVFRRDTRGLWEELVARALGRSAAVRPGIEKPRYRGAFGARLRRAVPPESGTLKGRVVPPCRVARMTVSLARSDDLDACPDVSPGFAPFARQLLGPLPCRVLVKQR